MAQVTDPVCGMTIESDRAVAREPHGDHFHYFCSSECARAFRDTPERYTAAERGGRGARAADLDVERRNPTVPGRELHLEHPDRLPPRTTEHEITTPMFGSAGSGGAEFEPIPEENIPDEPDTP